MTRFERLLAAIYGGIECLDYWHDAIDQIALHTGSRAGGLFIASEGRLCFDLDAGMPPEFMERFRIAVASDPRLAYAADQPRHTVLSDDVAALRTAMVESGLEPMVREFDLPFTSGTVLEHNGPGLALLYVSRSGRQGPLPGAQSDWLTLAAPHFARALRIRSELAAAREWLGSNTHEDTLVAGVVTAVAAVDVHGTLPRQLQRVLTRIAAGDSNAEIATALHVSINTVRTHIRRLFELSGVRRRTALLRQAALRGWLR